MKREFNEEFEIGRRRGVRCTARRLDVCGRKVDGGLEARRAVLPRARENKKREARVGESFSRDRALLRSAGASQAHYVSRLRFATLRKEPLLACQDLGIEVHFMLFRNQTLRNC